MKTHKADLDIDFIGGEEKLTKQEEQALSDYFKSKKLSKKRAAPARKIRQAMK